MQENQLPDMEAIFDALQYYGDDVLTKAHIARVVTRLPAVVQAWVMVHCVFLVFGQDYGSVWPARVATRRLGRDRTTNRGTWLVLLRDGLPKRDRDSIIAHELAHAWLRHDKLSEFVDQDPEREASELTRAWGFRGRGTMVAKASLG